MWKIKSRSNDRESKVEVSPEWTYYMQMMIGVRVRPHEADFK